MKVQLSKDEILSKLLFKDLLDKDFEKTGRQPEKAREKAECGCLRERERERERERQGIEIETRYKEIERVHVCACVRTSEKPKQNRSERKKSTCNNLKRG